MTLFQLNSSAISVAGALKDQSICFSPFSSSHCYLSRKLVSIQLFNSWKGHCTRKPSGRLKSAAVTSCKSSFGRFSGESDHSDKGRNREDDDDAGYLEAIILISETISHYRMLMHGFQEETKLQPSLQLGPFLVQPEDPRTQVSPMGSDFLRRFQSPTIFLKISCDGDFLLPIAVGESAIENLINSFNEDEREACPNRFQFTWNLVEHLGYGVKMVKITERVLNTYFARIILHKPGEMNSFSIDARPSDAINVAKRCKAPIFVNKQIVLADATRILYGMNPRRKKAIYDVILDSAIDGPDLISEEFNVVRKMNLAAQEERYSDAAMWKDKLRKIRNSK